MNMQAMAFYHEDGLVAAWNFAERYVGEGGHIATLPEIIDARLSTNPGDLPWETYFTTSSAEYFGRNREGNLVVVVAHGIGPMATLDGIMKAYSHEYKDKTRSRRGGRVTQQEFFALLDGEYGEVFVVDYAEYCNRYKYPFKEYLRATSVAGDPMLFARFGGRTRCEDLVIHHESFASAWTLERAGVDLPNLYGMDDARWEEYLSRRCDTLSYDVRDPFLIQVEDANNCSYEWGFKEGEVIAHLLSVGSLSTVHHEGHESLAFDVSCHEWWNGVRFVGVPAGATTTPIEPGPGSVRNMIEKHWRELMVPTVSPGQIGLRRLMQVDDTYFTMRPKQGASLDTDEPEFVVLDMVPLGEPVDFQTWIGGHEIFFRYDITEVKAIAPPGAGGYVVTDGIDVVWEDGNPRWHRTKLQFYRVTTDTTQRVMRAKVLARDLGKMVTLIS